MTDICQGKIELRKKGKYTIIKIVLIQRTSKEGEFIMKSKYAYRREWYTHMLGSPSDYYFESFKIIGNLYFVGSKDSASHLIDTGDGLIMIDTGYPNMAGFNTLNKIFIEEAGLNWRKDFEKSLDIWEWMQTDIYLGNYTPQSNVIKKRSTDEKKSFY